MSRIRKLETIFLVISLRVAILQEVRYHGEQPLSRIAIHKAIFTLHGQAYVKGSPELLGIKANYFSINLYTSLITWHTRNFVFIKVCRCSNPSFCLLRGPWLFYLLLHFYLNHFVSVGTDERLLLLLLFQYFRDKIQHAWR